MVLTPSSQPNSPKKAHPPSLKIPRSPKGAKCPSKISSSSKAKSPTSSKYQNNSSNAHRTKSSSKPTAKGSATTGPPSKPTENVPERVAEEEKRLRAERERGVRAELHEHQRVRSYALLDAARKRAREEWNYDSAEARRIMKEECVARSKGAITPHEWQLDIAECLVLGIDCELIAPTGSGKTIAFMLPPFYWQHKEGEGGDKAKGQTHQKAKPKVLIVVSPLNSLETDQVRVQTVYISP